MNHYRWIVYLCVLLFPFSHVGAWEVYESARHRDFMVVTPEKCGTHLLMKALEQMLRKKPNNCWLDHMPIEKVEKALTRAKNNNRFFHMHAIPYAELIQLLKKKNYKVIFLIRDPRDQALSLLHFIDAGWGYYTLCPDKPYGKLNFNDKLMEIITGHRYGISGVKHIVGRKMGWMFLPFDLVYTVRFENLVGEDGGGSRQLQLMEIRNIAAFLNVELSDEELQERSKGIFGSPGEKTFRNGQIGEWREFFKPMHVNAFKTSFGKELIQLGYEKDFNWSR